MTSAGFYRKMSIMNQRRFNNKPIPAGSILRRAAANALRRRGFGEWDVLARWPDIVGPELAALTAPEKLQQRRGDVAGAILHIRVDGSAALELQHKTPVVLERINAFYGYRAVDRLKLVQGPLPETEKTNEEPERNLTRAESVALARHTSSTKNVKLRDALARLGASILKRRDKPPKSDNSGL